MSRGTLRDRWRREVYRTPLVSNSVRVMLLALADDMQESGRVSVSRKAMAERLGLADPRRVTERYELAVSAGLLDRVRRGRPGVTAEYVATLPGGRTERVRVDRADRKLDRLTQPQSEPAQDGADVRTYPASHGADVRMMPELAPVLVRTSAPTGHAQHGADVQPAKGKDTGTAAGRAACGASTTEQRNDRDGAEQPARARAVGRGAA